jgi:hypothetical protein
MTMQTKVRHKEQKELCYPKIKLCQREDFKEIRLIHQITLDLMFLKIHNFDQLENLK